MADIEGTVLDNGKKIYFASDFHLGTPDKKKSKLREEAVVNWLNEVSKDAQIIYLVGDVFDFWFEYKHAIPKGHTRLLGKLAEISDSGIELNLFTGNHDMWIFDYLPKEIGLNLYREPQIRQYNEKLFYIGHGDGLGPGDYGYKFIKKVFANKFCQWLFKWIHPDLGIGMANFWSKTSRAATEEEEKTFLGADKEWLAVYAKEQLEKRSYDYFIFGHRHMPLDLDIEGKAKYINLGDWINHNTYAVFDGKELELKKYNKP